MAEKLGENITESELETIAQKYGTIIEKDGISKMLMKRKKIKKNMLIKITYLLNKNYQK